LSCLHSGLFGRPTSAIPQAREAREGANRVFDESSLSEKTRDATEAATRRVVAAGWFSGTDADAGADAGAGTGRGFEGSCDLSDQSGVGWRTRSTRGPMEVQIS
jgi:hypothetical protein